MEIALELWSMEILVNLWKVCAS